MSKIRKDGNALGLKGGDTPQKKTAAPRAIKATPKKSGVTVNGKRKNVGEDDHEDE